MGTGKSAYSVLGMGYNNNKFDTNIFFQSDINYLKSTQYAPRYFIKIYHWVME